MQRREETLYRDPSVEAFRVTPEGETILRLNQEHSEQKTGLSEASKELSEQGLIQLGLITRLIKGDRILAPVIVIEPGLGEVIMAKFYKSDHEEPVQVRLASDVYFEVTYDDHGNRIFSLRAEPRESPLVDQYVAELEAAMAA